MPTNTDQRTGILGRLKEVYGTDGGHIFPVLLSLEGTVSVGEIDGTFRTVWETSSGRFLTELDLGAFSRRSGNDGSKLWSADQLGNLTCRSNPNAIEEADVQLRFRHFEFLYNPDRYEIEEAAGGSLTIRVTRLGCGERAFGTHEFRVDPGTGLIVEQRGVEEGKGLTRTFADYTSVDGVQFPTVITERDHAGNEITYRITSTSTDVDIPPDLFSPPEPKADDFHFVDGGSSTVVPIAVPEGHIYVDVTVGRETVTFILDTGAEKTVISSELVEKLGFETLATAKAQGISGSQEYSVVAVPEMKIGGVVLTNQNMISMDISAISAVLPGVHGFLGLEFFDRFVVALDYVALNVRVFDRSTFAYKGSGATVRLDGRTCPITVNGHLGYFTIDTGSPVLDLYGWFATKHGMLADRESLPTRKGVAGMGNSEIEFFLGSAETVEIGGKVFNGMPVRMTETTEGIFANTAIAGNAGAVIWRRFVTWFDFAGERIVLEPNVNADEPFTGWKV